MRRGIQPLFSFRRLRRHWSQAWWNRLCYKGDYNSLILFRATIHKQLFSAVYT